MIFPREVTFCCFKHAAGIFLFAPGLLINLTITLRVTSSTLTPQLFMVCMKHRGYETAESQTTQPTHRWNLSPSLRKCLAEWLVGYCFSQMESDLVRASLLQAERRRRKGWCRGDAEVEKHSTFLFMLAGKQVARKWHRGMCCYHT